MPVKFDGLTTALAPVTRKAGLGVGGTGVGVGGVASVNNPPAPMVANAPNSTYSAPVMAPSAAAPPPVAPPTVSGIANISDDMKSHIRILRMWSNLRINTNLIHMNSQYSNNFHINIIP